MIMENKHVFFVDDLIDGMVRLMNSRDDFTGSVNICNPDEFTMIKLMEELTELTNSISKLKFILLQQNDPMQRQPNTSLAKKKLRWKPKIKLEKGWIKTTNYFNEFILSDFFKL